MPDRNEAGQFVSPEPEGEPQAGPDWEKLGDYDYVKNAVNMQRRFENVNTRRDAWKTLYNEQYDSDYVQFVEGQDQDEWAHLRPPAEEQYEYEQPQQQYQGFDPTQLPDLLAPVFDQNNERMFAMFQQYQAQQAQQQAWESAAQGAAREAGLPDALAPLVQQYVTEQAAQYPNRQPGELAKERADALLKEIRAMQVANVQPPQQGGPPPPDAPIAGDATPQTSEEALKWAMDNLPPGP